MPVQFQPGLVSGGRLSEQEYQERKRQCTEEALTSLQGSAEYKHWSRERQQPGWHSLLAARPALVSAALAVTLLLAASAATYSLWAKGGAAPDELIAPLPDGLEQLAAVFGEQDFAAAQYGEVDDAWVTADWAAPELVAPAEPPGRLEAAASEAAVLDAESMSVEEAGLPEDAAAEEEGQAEEPAAPEEAAPEQAAPADEAAPSEEPAPEQAALAEGPAWEDTALAAAAARQQELEEELQQRTAQQAQQAQEYEAQLTQLRQALEGERIQQAQQFGAQMAQLRQALESERAERTVLSHKLGAAELAVSTLQQENAELAAAAAAAQEAQPEPALDDIDAGSCPNDVAPALLGALPELYALYSAATLSLLAVVGAWRLHVRRVAAAVKAARNGRTAAGGTRSAEAAAEAAAQVAQLQKELAAVKKENKGLEEQLKASRAEASASAADAKQAHQSLLQIQTELEDQLSATREEAARAVDEAQGQVLEEREWHSAAQQLAAFTAAALTAACAAKGGSYSAASSPSPRSISPSKRRPLAARSRYGGQENACENENSMPSPSPLASGAGGPPSIAAAAAAALAAKVPDTPRAWLELLQARFAAVRDQAAAAERAALDADAALEVVRKESSWNQHKVSEMMTDNELLKERLADAKRHFQAATAAEAEAREAAAELKARVEEFERQAAAQTAVQAALAGRLAAAEAERAQLRALLDAAGEQVERTQALLAEAQARQDGGGGAEAERVQELAQELAARESEAAGLSEALAALERENSSLEAQADQVTESLMHTQQQKSQLEKKVADLEQELASLSILAQKLESDKAILEEQLSEARRAHAELCKAGKALAAAESTIRESTMQSMNSRAETPDAESDLRRAIHEKVAALDMLASAEKKMLEREAADDLAPLPLNSPLRPSSRASQLSGYAGDLTPRSRGAKIVNYFSSKLDKVARLMAGDSGADGRESLAGTPRSHAGSICSSAHGGSQSGLRGGGGRRVDATMTAWFDRLNQSFNSVGKVLHQDLAGFESPRASAGSDRAAAAAAAFETPRLEGMERAKEALEYSAAEVVEILAALDAAEQMEGHGAEVAAARGELHATHMAVQAAMREVQGCSHEAVLRKAERRDLLQEVQRLSGQIEFASEVVDTELELKAQTEDRVARAQEQLAAAEAELESAQHAKQAVESAQGDDGVAGDVGSELWEERLQANAEFERCVNQQRSALEELQAALAAKRDAIERVAAAASRLEAAEVQHEDAADGLDQAEADLNALAAQHLRLMDGLQAQQARQAAALQVAVRALERCLSPEGAAGSDEEEGEEEEEEGMQEGAAAQEVALSAAQLLPGSTGKPHLTLPQSEVTSMTGGGSSASNGSRARSPAEVAAELLDEGWWAKGHSHSMHSVHSGF